MRQLNIKKIKIIFENNFTKIFLLRLIFSVIISIMFVIFFSLFFKQKINQDYNNFQFKPVSKINRLANITFDSSSYNFELIEQNDKDVQKINLKLLNHELIQKKQTKLGCSRRQKALIFENLYIYNSWHEKNKHSYESFLIDIIEKYFVNSPLNCNQFIRDIKILEKLNLLGVGAHINKSQKIIENYLTEKTSWHWRSPCLYVKEGDKNFRYLTGSILNCYSNKKIKRFSSINFDNEINILGKVVYQQLQKSPSKYLVNSARNESFLITLEPQVQGWLNLYKKCFLNLNFCDVISIKNLAKIKGASVVILNSDNSEILGVLCLGIRCEEFGLNNYKDLAALQVKAPPASISKLLFSLSFAADKNIEKTMLLRQLKTSGQLNPELGRRNEWWEKNAICDEENTVDCRHYKNVAELSRLFGFATNCYSQNINKNKTEEKFSLNCGDIGLLKKINDKSTNKLNYGLSGFMGLNTLLNEVVPGDDGLVKFMSWKNYERLRRNKNLISRKIEFTNSSNVIQSVLGAGDTRVSALGIAALASQISQVASNNKPILPIIIKPKGTSKYPRIGTKNKELSKLNVDSAKNVILGMQKTLLKEEKNWLGNGTSYNSFKDVFEKECSNDCPIKGKTGTVSFNDRNYVGTTLFTGLVNPKKMQEYLSKNISTNLPKLAIGVIVFTDNDIPNGHYASHFFMSLVKDIISKKNLNQIVLDKESKIEKKYLLKYESR